MEANTAGVKNLDTFNHGPRHEIFEATRLFDGRFFRSAAMAWPSTDAEYWTKAPRMPEARRIPAVARQT